MDTSNLRAFLKIVDLGSTSLAARDLSMTQAGASMLLRRLERHYRAQLVQRRHGKILTTRAGQRLVTYAKEVVEAEHRLTRDLDVVRDGSGDWVRVGTTRTVGAHFLPPIISRFRASFPEVQVSLETAAIGVVRERLLNGDLDFVYMPEHDHDDVVNVPVRRDRLIVVARPEDPLASLHIVSPERIREQPFVVLDRNSELRVRFEAALGMTPSSRLTVALDVVDAESLKEAVMCGLGYGLMFTSLVERELREHQLQEIRVRGVDLVEEFCLVRRKKPELGWAAASLYDAIRCADTAEPATSPGR